MIKDSDLIEIAQLARIKIKKDDFINLKKDLQRILDLVEQMESAKTEDVIPMSHPLDISQPLRQDEVTEENEREKMQSTAPLVQSGLYLVPLVLDENKGN